MLHASRLRAFLLAGLLDSFGLAVGWTVFTLYAVARQGLEAAGLYNAAMLVGVALSAPATAWLATRLDNRRLLRRTALAEAALRLGTFVALLREAPTLIIACGVALMNVIAWSGYAGMRAEVANIARSSTALTWYAVTVGGIEAAGAACAALLPTRADHSLSPALLGFVIAVYGASLVPTFLVAARSRLPQAKLRPSADHIRRNSRPLIAGFLIMLLASGPTLLAIPLASTLYGRTAVAASAILFAAGALLAPLAARSLERSRLPSSVVWPAIGTAMIAGWIAAPTNLAGLLAAQLLSGLFLTLFQGTMDSKLARAAGPDSATSALAYSAASRALGSSLAVAATPLLSSAADIGKLSVAASSMLAGVALISLTARHALPEKWARKHIPRQASSARDAMTPLTDTNAAAVQAS